MVRAPAKAPTMGVGVDPAEHLGLALVTYQGPGRRYRLSGVWAVYGSTALSWRRRAREASATLARLLVSAEMPIVAWMEEPPPAVRRDALGGDRQGLRTWAGIGRRQGRFAEILYAATELAGAGLELDLRGQDDWTAVLGRDVAPKKWGTKDAFGEHRVREARFLLDGGEQLLALPASCRIDAAEAALVALAGLREARGERYYQETVLPSERRRDIARRRREGAC